ncbi:hypothetical protein CEXT_102911 [Caerostris extrusa]|uniref:LAGLIDADG homing endonuclease n=1 Tax=Caerostris extrusa TaxID=172846 RepID=A0AAV4X3P9_CAEEX|nr:hypothetical protein CEXT_102911 [Caerostris extrusa]
MLPIDTLCVELRVGYPYTTKTEEEEENGCCEEVRGHLSAPIITLGALLDNGHIRRSNNLEDLFGFGGFYGWKRGMIYYRTLNKTGKVAHVIIKYTKELFSKPTQTSPSSRNNLFIGESLFLKTYPNFVLPKYMKYRAIFVLPELRKAINVAFTNIGAPSLPKKNMPASKMSIVYAGTITIKGLLKH